LAGMDDARSTPLFADAVGRRHDSMAVVTRIASRPVTR